MSFVERNKAWILPLLGVAALGVLVMNLRMFSGKTPSRPQSPAPIATGRAPEAVAPPAGGPSTASDLWKDLQSLETPPAGLTTAAPLLRRCAAATSSLPLAVAHTDPVAWKRATDPPGVPATAKSAPAPEAKVGPITLPPPPELSFIAQTSHGLEAWFAGRPYREGATLPDGRRVRRITAQRVLLEGPGGSLERCVHALVPRSVPLQEIP